MGWGIPIVSPSEIEKYDSKTIVITASYFDDTYEGLKNVLKESFSEYEIFVAPYLWFMLVNVEYNSSLLTMANNFMENIKEELYVIYDKDDITTRYILDYIV